MVGRGFLWLVVVCLLVPDCLGHQPGADQFLLPNQLLETSPLNRTTAAPPPCLQWLMCVVSALTEDTAAAEPQHDLTVKLNRLIAEKDALSATLQRLDSNVEELIRRGGGFETRQKEPDSAEHCECGIPAGATEREPCEPTPSRAVDEGRPELPACARTCLQLRNQGGHHEDGVYWLSGMKVPVFCDFSHDEGGWTLLLTTTSKAGWDIFKVLERNPRSPSLVNNYSILRHANYIKDQGRTPRFAYRIEAQAEVSRQRWGGIWLAPREYTFISSQPNQTDVTLARKFNSWTYGTLSIEKIMPWIRDGLPHPDFIFTTSSNDKHPWGSLVTLPGDRLYNPNPWIRGTEAHHSGRVLYWVREEEL